MGSPMPTLRHGQATHAAIHLGHGGRYLALYDLLADRIIICTQGRARISSSTKERPPVRLLDATSDQPIAAARARCATSVVAGGCCITAADRRG